MGMRVRKSLKQARNHPNYWCSLVSLVGAGIGGSSPRRGPWRALEVCGCSVLNSNDTKRSSDPRASGLKGIRWAIYKLVRRKIGNSTLILLFKACWYPRWWANRLIKGCGRAMEVSVSLLGFLWENTFWMLFPGPKRSYFEHTALLLLKCQVNRIKLQWFANYGNWKYPRI